MKRLGPKKMFDNSFDNDRRLSYARSKCQAAFRGEQWSLSWEDYCIFWNTKKRWCQRGRSSNSLVLTRVNPESAWDIDNCCIITRTQQLTISVRRKTMLDVSDQYHGAIYYGQ
jgi:hypothetical protein